MRPTFILVHGAWHGGWCWEAVETRLRAEGFETVAPTLSGAGDTTLADHVEEIVGLIDATPGPLVLVGHSYGGMVITGASAARPERIARLVYLDALVPADGESVASFAGEDAAAGARALSAADNLVPTSFFPPSKFVDWQGEALDAFVARLRPQPVETFLQPVALGAGAPAVPTDYVLATDDPLGLFDGFAAAARGRPGWLVYELPVRHDVMLTAPGVVAAILAAPWSERAA